jgi:hypothetical protein
LRLESYREYDEKGKLVSAIPGGRPMYFDGVLNRKKTRRRFGLGLLVPRPQLPERIEIRLSSVEKTKFRALMRLNKTSMQQFFRGIVLDIIEKAGVADGDESEG